MAIVTITCENDADFMRGFAYQTLLSDGVTAGPPVDLTGNTLRMGVRHHAADIEEDLLLTTENGALTITDAVNGKFTVWITNEQLVQLPLGTYDHSLIRIVTATGLQLRIWSGTLTINPGPSRSAG
jgi:hypothetical protein